MGRLEDKAVLITGGARGQGAAEAALFKREGAAVFVGDIRDSEGAELANRIGATFLRHEVTSSEDWVAAVERILNECGRLDVLVNNAGILPWARMMETTRDVWDDVVAVNQTGVFLGMQAVTPTMIERGSGSIINVSSIGGIRGTSPAFAYGATKWAVRGMTKSAAIELGPHGIRVNSIHPGIVDTPMMDDQPLEKMARALPLRRCASPSEIANIALWLASDESSYATGAEFVVDGGYTA
jgi:3alpha(or 20beta)-hydroxysteroid dehydrogenase